MSAAAFNLDKTSCFFFIAADNNVASAPGSSFTSCVLLQFELRVSLSLLSSCVEPSWAVVLQTAQSKETFTCYLRKSRRQTELAFWFSSFFRPGILFMLLSFVWAALFCFSVKTIEVLMIKEVNWLKSFFCMLSSSCNCFSTHLQSLFSAIRVKDNLLALLFESCCHPQSIHQTILQFLFVCLFFVDF